MRDDLDAPSLSEQFRLFGQHAGRDGVPLYERICTGIADDDELLALMNIAPVDQRRPNLLLNAVHYLFLSGTDHPLARRYATVSAWRDERPDAMDDAAQRAAGDPFGEFRDFCRGHRTEVAQLVATRATQTNEVGRCSTLMPAFCALSARHGPLALLDLGASAGLNLLFDRYAYDYGGAGRAGDRRSVVELTCELRHGTLPDLSSPPAVRYRAGIDRRPVDPDDEDQCRWLLACQWPDQVERFRRLRAALALARAASDHPPVLAGDMITDLPRLVDAVPADVHLCILHTWVAAYLSPDRQSELAATIESVGRARPVSWLFAELPFEVPSLPIPPSPPGLGTDLATAVVLVEIDGPRHQPRRIADTHAHGRWLSWWGWES